jgi:hypothetical protein
MRPNFLGWLNALKPQNHKPHRNNARSLPLQVEELERRDVPSVVIWQDALSDTDGTDITAHSPAVPSGGAYAYSSQNQGGFQIVGNRLQGTNDGGTNRVLFDPGDANSTTASVDFYLSDAGTSPSIYYDLRLITRYGDDDNGGEGYEAFLAHNGLASAAWTLDLLMVGPDGGVLMADTSIPLSQDTWYTLQISTDPNNNITVSVPGLGSCSAADPDAAYMANTQVAIDTDASNEIALRNIVVTEPVVTLASPNNQSNYDGDPVSLPLAATDSAGNALTYTASGLPSGLGVNSGGVITGTIANNADMSSPYSVTVTATDTVADESASQTFSWAVSPVTVSLTSPGDQTNYDGDTVSLQLSASENASHALTYGATGLPSGIGINSSTGVISGTLASNADTGSPYSVTVTASDSAADVSASQTFSWAVSPVTVTLTSPGDQTNSDGNAVQLWLTANDSAWHQLTFTANGLPPGLSVTSWGKIHGTISSTADADSPYSVTVTATDSAADVSASATFSWYVSPVSLTQPGEQFNFDGDSVSLPLSATDADGNSLTYSASGLPAGLSVNNGTGVISGSIATDADTNSPYAVTVTASDSTTDTSASQTFDWTVSPVAVSVASQGNQSNYDGDAVRQWLSTADSAGNPLTFSATGLPAGLNITTSGKIYGTINSGDDAESPYSVTITATDSTADVSGSATFIWAVSPVTVSLTDPGSQANFDGDNVSFDLAATDSAGHALAYSVDSETPLPAGLNLNDHTGKIWGTVADRADVDSPYSITVTATDAAADVSASQTFIWTVTWINHAPSGTNGAVSVLENGSYTFATADFGFSDPIGGNALQAVEITTLPTAGALTDNGVITAGQFVSASDIASGLLVYTPNSGGRGAPYDSFEFQVQDNGGTANGGVNTDPSPRTMTINVAQQIFVWNGAGSDNLASDGANWVGGVAPANGDIAIFNSTSDKDATFDTAFATSLAEVDIAPGYTGQITLEQDLTITASLIQIGGVIAMGDNNLNIASAATYSMSAGNLDGPGYLNIEGTVNWSGGSWDPGVAHVEEGAEFDIDPEGSVNLTGWTIIVDGNLNWTQGNVENTDSTVDVNAGGAFDISSPDAWLDAPRDGGSSINNAGTLNSAAGTASAPISIQAALNSSNALNVNSGAISLKNGGSFCGTIAVADGSTLALAHGDFSGGAVSFAGGGTLRINGNYDVDENQSIPNTVDLVANGNISGTATFTSTGQFNWAAGRMSGTGSTVLNGTTTVSFAALRPTVDERTVVNNGTMSLVGNAMGPTLGFIRNASLVNNGQISLTTVANSTAVLGIRMTTGASLVNNRVIYVSGGGAASISSPGTAITTNAGWIRVQGGSLALVGNFNSTGYLDAAAGAAVNFDDGTFTFQPPGRNRTRLNAMRGAGQFNVNAGANIVVPQNLIVFASNFYLTAGTLGGAGDFQAQSFFWSGGTMSGPGTTIVASEDQMLISGNVTLNGRTLEDNGSITWQYTELPYTIAMMNSSQILINGGSFVTFNVAGEITTDQGPLNPNSNNQIIVSNGGSFTRNSTEVSGTIAIRVAFQNNGGEVNLQGNTNFASFVQTGAASVSTFGAGTYRVRGPNPDDTARISSGGTIQLQGAHILGGVGMFNTTFVGYGEVGALLANRCTITLTANLSVDSISAFGNQTITNLGGFQLSSSFLTNNAGCTINLQGGTLPRNVRNEGTINN